MEEGKRVDVIIVGGGPAGLSAALLLGRCCRRVLLFDTNESRNRATKAVHGFLSRDGIAPAELRRICFRQLRPYRSVVTREGRIVKARAEPGGFAVGHENGELFRCRKLLVATGAKDDLPAIPGIERFYGRSAFHCPLCDGWEHRDQPLAICGKGTTACGYALELFSWSRDITLCAGGGPKLKRDEVKRLQDVGIRITESKVTRLSGRGRQLAKVHFEDGTSIACRGFFFCSEETPQSDLTAQLGIDTMEDGRARHDRMERTNVPGLYVAGNTSSGVQLAIVAAAEGAKAAYAINNELNQENLDTFRSG